MLLYKIAWMGKQKTSYHAATCATQLQHVLM